MTRAAEHRLINPRTLTPASVPLSMCLAWLAVFRLAPAEMYARATSAPCLLLGSWLAALFGGLVFFFDTSWSAQEAKS